MMKSIKYVWVALLLIVTVPFLQAQTIELQEGNPVTKTYVLRCADNLKMDTIPLTTTFSYNENEQVITIEFEPRLRDYDLLWFPPQDFENRKGVKYFTEHFTPGIYDHSRTFRSQIGSWEIKPAFVGVNCEWTKPANWTKLNKTDMLNWCYCTKKQKQKTFTFKIANPDELVQITLQTLVPIRTKPTASGADKYEYQFIADRIRINIQCKAKPVPCEFASNQALVDRVATLQEQVDADYGRLQQCQEPQSHQECMDILKKINEEYVPQFNDDYHIFKKSIENDSVCLEIENQLEQLMNGIKTAQDFVCPAELNPCELTSNILLSDRIETLHGQIRHAHDNLMEWEKEKKREECIREQRQIEVVYREQYLGYYLDFREQDTVCPEIEGKLQQLNDALNVALDLTCPKPKIKIPPTPDTTRTPPITIPPKTAEIAKNIEQKSNTLQSVNSAIKSDNNRREHIRKGRELIKEVDDLIRSLSDAAKSEEKTAAAIKYYNITKGTFNKISR